MVGKEESSSSGRQRERALLVVGRESSSSGRQRKRELF